MKVLSDGVWTEMQAQNAFLREQNKHLTEQLVEMKRDGFARPTPQMVVEAVKVPDLDDRILVAIRTVAPEGSRLESELRDFADGLLKAGDEVEDVSDRILAGASFGEDD